MARMKHNKNCRVSYLTENFFKIYFFLVLVLGEVSFLNELKAEEHGGSSNKSSGEAQEGEVESAEKKEGAGAFIKKDEFLELNSSIEQLTAKVKSKNENLQKLLSDKDHIKESLEFKKIVKQIEVEYREIKDILENIEKKKTILRHRFPEKSFVKGGDKAKEQKEDEISLDAALEKKVNQLIKLAETQYKGKIAPKKNESQKVETERVPASEKEISTESNQNPEDFSRSLILKK